MADNLRVHPDPVPNLEAGETKPTAPLVPRNFSRSENGDPGVIYSPPLQRTIPPSYSKPPKRRNCCCRFFCWILCLLFSLVLIIGILAAVVYFGFHPKIPKYSVSNMNITQFNLNNNNSLYAVFDLNITATNPNKRIGLYYEGGSHISVWYTSTKLCEGPFPKFYQGHHNTTYLDVPLTGQTDDASNLFSTLQAQQQKTGNIPLRLRVKVPVRIKLGKLKLPKWKFLFRCSLLVDSLAADNTIRVKNSSCKYRFSI